MTTDHAGEGQPSGLDEQEIDQRIRQRPRSATLLNMKWLAERLRKARLLKKGIEDGSYAIDSSKLAKALLNHDGDD